MHVLHPNCDFDITTLEKVIYVPLTLGRKVTTVYITLLHALLEIDYTCGRPPQFGQYLSSLLLAIHLVKETYMVTINPILCG